MPGKFHREERWSLKPSNDSPKLIFYPDYSDLRINISKTLITYLLLLLLEKYFQIPTANYFW